MVFLIGCAVVVAGVTLIVVSKPITDLNGRINKSLFGIWTPRAMSQVGRVVSVFVGVWWVILGLWVLFTAVASYFR